MIRIWHSWRLALFLVGTALGQQQKAIGTPAGTGRSLLAFTREFRPSLIDTDVQDAIYIVGEDGGNPKRIVDGAYPAWSPDGKQLAFLSPGAFSHKPHQLWIVNGDGSNPQQLTDEPKGVRLYSRPAWSPDGQEIAYVCGNWQLCIVSVRNKKRRQLTAGFSPSWSPDGKSLAFISGEKQSFDIMVTNIDGSGTRQLTRYKKHLTALAWSPDGKQIAVAGELAHPDAAIYLISADGSETSEFAYTKGVTMDNPSWKPDGSAIAFNAYKSNHEFANVVVPATFHYVFVRTIGGKDTHKVFKETGSQPSYGLVRAPQ